MTLARARIVKGPIPTARVLPKAVVDAKEEAARIVAGAKAEADAIERAARDGAAAHAAAAAEDARQRMIATTAAELIDFCAERLADYKVPSQVDFIDALPRNGMNRVMKGALTGEDAGLTS